MEMVSWPDGDKPEFVPDAHSGQRRTRHARRAGLFRVPTSGLIGNLDDSPPDGWGEPDWTTNSTRRTRMQLDARDEQRGDATAITAGNIELMCVMCVLACYLILNLVSFSSRPSETLVLGKAGPGPVPAPPLRLQSSMANSSSRRDPPLHAPRS